MADAMAKPVCGAAASTEEYDLGLHIGAIFLVLAASIFGAGFPVVAKKVKWMRIPPTLFFICKHFGTGVLIATAFVHLLPTAFGALSNPCLPDILIEDYPAMPGVIMMAALFALFVIEMWLNAKTGGHSHGGATGHGIIPGRGSRIYDANHPAAPGPNPPASARHSHFPGSTLPVIRSDSLSSEEDLVEKEKQMAKQLNLRQSSEIPPWFMAFYEQFNHHREDMNKMMKSYMPSVYENTKAAESTSTFETGSDSEEQAVSPAELKRMNMNITMLEGGILFHSVFVGMTISITTEGFITLLVAIMFHQLFEGLGLGSRIAAVPYAKKSIRPWVLVVAFGTTAPFGQFLGIVTRNSYDPESAFGLILVGVFNAISSGLLIYASLVDLLAQDFLSEEANHEMKGRRKVIAFLWVLLGAAGMSVVGAFA